MAELVFPAEMRGNLAPVAGKDNTFTFNGSGRGPNGEAATTHTEVVIGSDGFKETGTIELGGRGKVNFETVGFGHLEPSPVTDLQCGAVMWRITGGEGEFQGALGYITSNFTVNASGEVVDNNYLRIYTS
jgi:hypothetical protein